MKDKKSAKIQNKFSFVRCELLEGCRKIKNRWSHDQKKIRLKLNDWYFILSKSIISDTVHKHNIHFEMIMATYQMFWLLHTPTITTDREKKPSNWMLNLYVLCHEKKNYFTARHIVTMNKSFHTGRIWNIAFDETHECEFY